MTCGGLAARVLGRTRQGCWPPGAGVLTSRGSRRGARCTRPVPLSTMKRYGWENNSGRAGLLAASLAGYVAAGAGAGAAGRLPPQGSTSTVVLTPAVAEALGTGVGGTVSYRFQPVDAQRSPAGKPFTRSFRVAAIVSVPPALVDESDQEEGSIFPPGATR